MSRHSLNLRGKQLSQVQSGTRDYGASYKSLYIQELQVLVTALLLSILFHHFGLLACYNSE